VDDSQVKPPKFFIRRFLNKDPHYSVAAIVAKIDRYGDTELRISDCNNSISLSLHGGDHNREDEWDNNMYKLDTIVEVVQALRNQIAKQARKDGWVEPKRRKQ
jgi:hypothetical protein